MRKVQTWFDIWGAMQGGTNDAMATGVECAKVLLIFLSKAYVSSVNCQLEFRYAVQRGKAFVVLHTEPSIPLERWMSDAFEGFPRFDVYSYDVLPQLINGVPMVNSSSPVVPDLLSLRLDRCDRPKPARSRPRSTFRSCRQWFE